MTGGEFIYMIEFLIGLIIFAVVFYIVILVINFLIAQLSLPPQIRTIVLLVVGLIGLIILLQNLGLAAGGMSFLR